jgi:2-succinyl-5-enolpyruvyl-6-hydroxy-3-cyclohexene-1-carboxylate synthase
VVRIGGLPTSKPLWTWLENHPGVPQVLLDDGDWRDPLATATRIVRGDPASTLAAIAAAGIEAAPAGWCEGWLAADETARNALDDALAAEGFPTEPGAVRTVVDALPDGATLWAASSMPVRDLDLVTPALSRDLRFMANRGANGIDGFVSTALGAAGAGNRATYALAGDLSVVHDIGALVTAGRLDIDLTLVVLDNNGGGIFHMLPQAGATRHFEKHFGTPHGVDLVAVAEAIGIPARYVESAADLDAAIAIEPDGPQMLVVETDRAENTAVHQRIRDAVKERLEADG